MVINHISFLSPLGWLSIFEESHKLIAVEIGKSPISHENPTLLKAKELLLEYFSKSRQGFGIPINPEGSEFQLAVWREILKVPYGKTQTYGSIATTLKTSPRAVGTACGKNPLPFFIPCHRIIGAGKSIGGFSFGLKEKTKLYLLRLEATSINDIKRYDKAKE